MRHTTLKHLESSQLGDEGLALVILRELLAQGVIANAGVLKDEHVDSHTELPGTCHRLLTDVCLLEF